MVPFPCHTDFVLSWNSAYKQSHPQCRCGSPQTCPDSGAGLNAVLAQYLVRYTRLDENPRQRQAALESLLTLAEQGQAGRGESTWTRDELHER